MRRSIHITSGGGNGYLPETNLWINAVLATGDTLSTPQQDGMDRYIRDLFGYANGSYSTYNVFSKIVLCRPYIKGDYPADRINCVLPGTYDSTDTGSPTYSNVNLNVSYNGSSQFSDQMFTPNGATTIGTADFTGFGFHRTDTATGSPANGQIGANGSGYSYANFNVPFKDFKEGGITAYVQSDANAVNGLWDVGWSSSTALNTYYNGARIKQVTSSTFNASPVRSFYQGAVHDVSGALYSSTCAFDFHYEKNGTWTDAECQMMYNSTKALKSVFGITWL